MNKQDGVISQVTKKVTFDLTVTTVANHAERTATEVSTEGDVRALDMLTCCGVMAMTLSEALGSEDKFYEALQHRIDEMKKVG